MLRCVYLWPQTCLTACPAFFSLSFSLSLRVLYVLPSSKEQSGEKTNNGTHYKLQLLYSNGELIPRRPRSRVRSVRTLAHMWAH